MQVITIGIDLAKNVFQVHGVAANDKVVFNKPLRRSQVLPFFAKLPPCLIGMEACASAHYWARELKKLGHDVRLMQHRVRDLLIRQRTQAINALRSHLAELGIVAAQGYDGLKMLLAIIADGSDARVPEHARASLTALVMQISSCQAEI